MIWKVLNRHEFQSNGKKWKENGQNNIEKGNKIGKSTVFHINLVGIVSKKQAFKLK